ncbi:MAG: DUF1206 domain-containing protein [Gemmatimonadaceae bacterium]|nr:DUF1206 domain-containing protein [Gemmatimonadaceae bacterium]
MTLSSRNIPSPASALRHSSPWIVKLARLGYASKGAVYIVMGFLATEAAFGFGGRTTDTKGALRAIGEASFGKFALGVTMIGLFGYAVWRLTSAVTDAEGRGSEPKGIALRVGDALRGLAYGTLAIWTFKFLTARHAGGGNQTRTLTDRVMGMPGGRWVVIAAGLGMIGYAVYQLYRAYSGKFLKRLDLTSAKSELRQGVERAGKFGIAARGVVFGMIGVLLIRAGMTYDPSKAGGIRESLNALAREPMGRILYGGVALGLIAFGVFEIATARYRVMRAV